MDSVLTLGMQKGNTKQIKHVATNGEISGARYAPGGARFFSL